MKIVADGNIPGIHEWCGSLGDIELVEGRHLRREQLLNAEVLLVRSVTPVNAALLVGTPVRFVGSATAGVDHIDLEFLRTHDIQFAAAPGCNAIAVAEYVLTCCLAYADEIQQPLAQLTVGVVGHGHVGSAVVRLLSVLGVRCLVNDPPRAAQASGPPYLPLSEVLGADVVTLHVPLIATGPHSTWNLIGKKQMAGLSPHALVINTARGGVLAERDWLESVRSQRLALDCWIGEPRIDEALCNVCWIASPHIAGHTVDARWRATEVLARQLAAYLSTTLTLADLAPLPTVPLVLRDDATMNPLRRLLFAICDPSAYTLAMRARPESASSHPGRYFDQLRRRLGARREFSAYTVAGATVDGMQRDLLQTLGFKLAA